MMMDPENIVGPHPYYPVVCETAGCWAYSTADARMTP